MYWFYLTIFIIAVMIPDIFREDAFGLQHEQIDQLAILIIGIAGFLFFIIKEHQLELQLKEKNNEQRRLQQTAKDLVESYSYIGEINRKMDMLMQIGIGLSERTNLNIKKERDICQSITEAASFLLKARCATIVFYDVNAKEIIRNVCLDEKCENLNTDADFFVMEDNVEIKSIDDNFIICSHKIINGVRSYLIIKSFDKNQSADNNNQEILKYLVSQTLFLYNAVDKKE